MNNNTKYKKLEDHLIKNIKNDINSNIDTKNIIFTFGIIGMSIGTIVGLSSNDLVKSFSFNIIKPFLDLLFKNIGIPNFKINGILVCVDKFIYQLISFFIMLLFVYGILKYIIGNFISEAIEDNKIVDNVKIRQNSVIISKLHDLLKLTEEKSVPQNSYYRAF